MSDGIRYSELSPEELATLEGWDKGEKELSDLPARVRNNLIRGGFTSRAEVAHASDTVLLSVRNVGRDALAIIRQHIPQVIARPERRCPHCGEILPPDA